MNANKFRMRTLALAMPGVLFALAGDASAAPEDDLAEFATPDSTVEVGVANTGRASNKFGEYNGLRKSGATGIVNFDVRGGNAYMSETGTYRWEARGEDLGTTSPTVGFSAGNQGSWKVDVGYDGLRHYTTSNFQTPYAGSMGGNSFMVSPAFQTPAITNTDALNAASQGPDKFSTMDVYTERKNTSLNASYLLDKQWKVVLEYNHLDQSGAKLMAFGQDRVTGAAAGEKTAILPNPTNYKTDTINLALHWTGEDAYASAGYFGSYFRDKYDRVTFNTFWSGSSATLVDTMSTAPNNDFHQINFNGGMSLSPATKLVGGLSWGRNTQNDAFVNTGLMATASPISSLNGAVNTSHADLRLSNQTSKDLALSASLKYDKRDNKTASNLFDFSSIAGTGATLAGVTHRAIYPNAPYSNKKTSLELAGDYRIDKNQRLRLSYDHSEVKRWCNNYATNNILGPVVAPAVQSWYPAGTDCLTDPKTKDDKLTAAYRFKVNQDVSLQATYAYDQRRTSYDPTAITAMIGTNGNFVYPSTAALPATAIRGLNGGDFPGFHPYFDASRNQQMIKGGINWQASKELSLSVDARYTDDKYKDDTYGIQKGSSWSLNLDSTYVFDENASMSAYVTQQHRERQMTNLVGITAVTSSGTSATGTTFSRPASWGNTWTNLLKDNDLTVGLGAKIGGLMGDKLDIKGDITYSLAKTSYGTQWNYAATAFTPGAASTTSSGLTCASSFFLTCGDVPDIKSNLLQVKLVGNYKLDKHSQIEVGYLHQRLKADDYFYNGLQYGYTPNAVLPTNQNSGSYSVNVVAASYRYSFK